MKCLSRLCLLMISTIAALAQDTNKCLNPSFDEGAKHWSLWFAKVDDSQATAKPGKSLQLTFDKAIQKGQAIASQIISLNQKQPVPFLYGCASKAQNLPADAAPSHATYGIELCITYQDKTTEWLSPKDRFSSGTHGWERVQGLFIPHRPIKDVRFYCRLKNTGTVWYDDFFLRETTPASTPQPCSIRENGNAEIILENQFLQLILSPTKGGTCRKLVVKVQNANYAGKQHPSYCMFTDKLRVKGNSYSRNYAPEIVRNTPETAEVRLTLNALDGYPFLKLQKTFTLFKHSAALKVTYAYTNLKASMADLIFEPYFRNGWNLQAAPTQHYLLQTKDRIAKFDAQGGDTYVKNLTAGWIAAADGMGKAMVCEFDYSRVNMFYLWRGGQDKTTVEWCFSPVKIPLGKTFETGLTFYPATSLKAIENAENTIASELIRKQDGISLNFSAASAFFLTCKATAIRKDNSQKTYTQLLHFQPDKPVTMSLPESPDSLSLVSYELLSKGTSVFSAQHPFVKGHVFQPKQPKAKPAEIEPFKLELTNQVVTPHTNWAKPYAGGRPRVLFIAELSQLREVVELSQRMDLDHRVIRIAEIEAHGNWGMCDRYGSFTFNDANYSLKDELKKPLDVIVVSGMLWKHLDTANKMTIEKLCQQGTGLVLIAPAHLPDTIASLINRPLTSATKRPDIASFQPLELIPHQLMKTPASLMRMTKLSPCLAVSETAHNRNALITWGAWNGLTPYLAFGKSEPDFRYQDYSLSLLARTIFWAARKDSGTKITSLFCKDGNVHVSLDSSSPVSDLTAKLSIFNLPTQQRTESITKVRSAKSFTIPLPTTHLPGTTICDFILTTPQGTLDWGTICLKQPLTENITVLKLDQDFLTPGKAITGTVRTQTAANAVLQLQLADGYGRIMAQQMQPSAPEMRFSLDVPEALTGRLFVTATLLRKNTTLHTLCKDFLMRPTAPVSTLPFAVGESGYRWASKQRRYLIPYRFQALKDGGVNELRFWTSDGPQAYRDHLAYGFRFDFPLASHHLWHFNKDFSEPYAKTKDKKYLCRKPCLSDPDFLDTYKQNIEKKLAPLATFSPISFDVGDENSLTLWGMPFDFCFSPHCLKAFRNWLRNAYPSLQALNREWNTDFKSWEQVTPLTTDEARKTGGAKRQYAPWADHRRFMEITFCHAFDIVRDTLTEHQQDIPIDMSGTQPPNAYSGMDFWLLSKSIKVPAAYDSDNNAEIIRSFGRPLMKPWYGYGNDGPKVEYRAWYDAFRFQNYGISYYTGINFLYPDYTLPRQVRELKQHLQDLRTGGAALLKTLHETPQVLIHYSHSSIHAAVIENRYPDFLAARALWCKLLDDMHIAYRFIAYAEIEDGELNRNPARILILPQSAAISQKEADQIKAFARQGGLVVADRFPAIMNQHCTLQNKGLLDDLFALPQPDLTGSTNTTLTPNGQPILAAVGNARGQNPKLSQKAFFLNPFHMGAGLFLNLHWPQYLNLRQLTGQKGKGAASYRNLLRKLFEPYLMDHAIAFKGPDFSFTKAFSYHQPEVSKGPRFIGLVRECEASQQNHPLHITLKQPAFIYDIRQRSYLGHNDHLDVTLPNGKAAFLAALPYEVKGLRLTGPESATPGDSITLQATILRQPDNCPSLHPLNIQVFRPDGNLVPYYSTIRNTSKGTAALTFRTALNDHLGTWKIQVTDTISGKQTTHVMTLRKK